MNIVCNNSPSFGMNFVKSPALREVVDYAAKEGKLLQLDSAMNMLRNVNGGDVLIVHGKTPAGIFSSFVMGKRSVQNLANGAKSAPEASFNAIIELSQLGRSFRRLVGGDVKVKLTPESLLNKNDMYV